MEIHLSKSKEKKPSTKQLLQQIANTTHHSSYELENDNKCDNGLHIVLPCFHGVGTIPRITTMHRQGNEDHDMYIQSDLSGFSGPKIAEYTTRAQH